MYDISAEEPGRADDDKIPEDDNSIGLAYIVLNSSRGPPSISSGSSGIPYLWIGEIGRSPTLEEWEEVT